jgi:hypothetical protein
MTLEIPQIKDENGEPSMLYDLMFDFLKAPELKSEQSHVANSLSKMMLFDTKLKSISEEFD